MPAAPSGIASEVGFAISGFANAVGATSNTKNADR
jgi:hypothetical protein